MLSTSLFVTFCDMQYLEQTTACDSAAHPSAWDKGNPAHVKAANRQGQQLAYFVEELC